MMICKENRSEIHWDLTQSLISILIQSQIIIQLWYITPSLYPATNIPFSQSFHQQLSTSKWNQEQQGLVWISCSTRYFDVTISVTNFLLLLILTLFIVVILPPTPINDTYHHWPTPDPFTATYFLPIRQGKWKIPQRGGGGRQYWWPPRRWFSLSTSASSFQTASVKVVKSPNPFITQPPPPPPHPPPMGPWICCSGGCLFYCSQGNLFQPQVICVLFGTSNGGIGQREI